MIKEIALFAGTWILLSIVCLAFWNALIGNDNNNYPH
jgi:hypothetical protein